MRVRAEVLEWEHGDRELTVSALEQDEWPLDTVAVDLSVEGLVPDVVPVNTGTVKVHVIWNHWSGWDLCELTTVGTLSVERVPSSVGDLLALRIDAPALAGSSIDLLGLVVTLSIALRRLGTFASGHLGTETLCDSNTLWHLTDGIPNSEVVGA